MRHPPWKVIGDNVTNMQDQTYSIFVSHAAVDEEIARSLKQYLEQVFPEQRVFVSTDPEDLKPGDEWVVNVLNALESAKCVLALTTERGLGRKWVWFESGRSWFSQVKLVPCCIGKIRKCNLPAPFSGRMAVNIDEPRDAAALFALLQGEFGAAAKLPDYREFVQTMVRLDVRAEEKSKILEDPYTSEIMSGIERTMKSLSPAERETLKQFAIYGELSTAGAKSRTKETGVDMGRWSVPSSLAERTGWLTPSAGNTPYDDMQQNVYSINATVRPHLRAYFSRGT